jgi:hypothetical protein
MVISLPTWAFKNPVIYNYHLGQTKDIYTENQVILLTKPPTINAQKGRGALFNFSQNITVDFMLLRNSLSKNPVL